MLILLQLEGISTANISLKKKKGADVNAMWKKRFWFFCKVIHLWFTKIQEETRQMESSLEKQRNGCFQNIKLKLLRKNFLDLLCQCISKISCNNYNWERDCTTFLPKDISPLLHFIPVTFLSATFLPGRHFTLCDISPLRHFSLETFSLLFKISTKIT